MTSEDRLPARYWRLWWAGAIDNVGNGALVTAVPLLAVTLTPDPRLISMVAAGAMNIGSLTVAAFAIGVGQVVFGIASQSVLPEIVDTRLLGLANTRQYLATTIGQSFVGPPVGSLLFGLAVALPFGLDAVALVVSAVLLTTLRGASPSRLRETGTPQRHAIIEGLRWLVRHRLLRTLALLLGVNTFCFQLGNVTLVLLATRELGVTPAGYGLLLAVAAVGSVLGGLLTAWLVRAVGQIPVLAVALAINAVAFVLLGLSPNAWVLAALLTLSALVTAMWNVVTVTLRQELVPLDLLGRVNSVYRLLGWGLIPLGALAGGFIAHEIGIRAAYPIAGTLRVVALAVSLPILVRVYRQGPPSGGD
jgi:MFS family permease